MKRFLLSSNARRDLAQIKAWIDDLPVRPARHIANALNNAFDSIASNPFEVPADSALTRLFGQEVRSRLVKPYRVYSFTDGKHPEIIAILHGNRDKSALLAARVQ